MKKIVISNNIIILIGQPQRCHQHSSLKRQTTLRWLSNQRSYMTNGGFEIRLNIQIYDNINGHRLFNMYQIINYFCYMLEYDVLNIFFKI